MDVASFLNPSLALPNHEFSQRPDDWTSTGSNIELSYLDWCERFLETRSCTEQLTANRIEWTHPEFANFYERSRRAEILQFGEIDLSEREYNRANLTRIFAAAVDFRDSDFSETILNGASLEGANLTDSRFDDAEVIRVDASFADFSRSTFNSANLTGSWFYWTTLEDVTFDNANLASTDFVFSNLSRLKWINSQETEYLNLTLWLADLQESTIEKAHFQGAHLSVVDLRNSVLRDVTFHDGDFYDIKFSSSRLSNVSIANSLVRYSRFDDISNIDQVSFQGSNFEGSMFRNIDLSEVDGLSEVGLRNTFGDGSVILPEGVSAPCQWRDEVLENDRDFASYWKGWVERDPRPLKFEYFASDFGEVTAAQAPEECLWSTN